jgi:hypothetical protein
MDFTDFEKSIQSTNLKAIARHWNEARGGRLMPAWQDIKPARIAGQLPIVWSYVYDHGTDEFTGRLAGDRIVQVFHKPIRGQSLKDVHPAETFPWIQGMLRRVVTESMAFHSAGPVYKQRNRFELGERIVLPLGASGLAGDGVLGATEYQRAQFVAGVEIEPVAPMEEWYSLKPPVGSFTAR